MQDGTEIGFVSPAADGKKKHVFQKISNVIIFPETWGQNIQDFSKYTEFF